MTQFKPWVGLLLATLMVGCAPTPPPQPAAPADMCNGGKPSPRKKDAVVVLGEVKSPRRIPWRCGLTASEAIAAAGGFSVFASPNKTMISRNSPQGKRRFQIQDPRHLDNLVLARGDVIVAQAAGLGL